MHKIINWIKHTSKRINYKKTGLALGFFLVLVSIALSNTLHEKYPDEFDNLLGGRYISEGKMIYRDFFTHHGPVPYFITAALIPFTGLSFVNIRLAYAFLLIAVFIYYFSYLNKKDNQISKLFLIFIPLWLISSVYFWGHMILADNIAAIAFIPVYVLLLISMYKNINLRLPDIILLSITIAIAQLSSLSYTYLSLLCYLAIGVLLLIQAPKIKQLFKFALILAAPYLVFLLYLITTGSLSHYYQQNIQFNSQYYIYNYPRAEGSTLINPVRYAIVISYNYIKNTHPLLTNIPRMDLYYPFNTTLAFVNAALIIFMLCKKKWHIAAFLFFALAFMNARSSPVDSGERDYQSAVYITISLFNMLFVIHLLAKDLNESAKLNAQKIIFTALFLITSILTVFTSIFIFRKWADFSYLKYMGQYPIIYDRPTLAPIINAVVSDNEYMWIGPFDFEDLFYAKGKLPSKYHILLPAMAKNGMAQQLQADIEQKQPKIIIYDWHLFVLGNAPIDYASEFTDYLNNNYIRLLTYQDQNGTQYVSTQPIEFRRDVEAKMYINPEHIDQVVSDLLNAGIIKVKEQ